MLSQNVRRSGKKRINSLESTLHPLAEHWENAQAAEAKLMRNTTAEIGRSNQEYADQLSQVKNETKARIAKIEKTSAERITGIQDETSKQVRSLEKSHANSFSKALQKDTTEWIIGVQDETAKQIQEMKHKNAKDLEAFGSRLMSKFQTMQAQNEENVKHLEMTKVVLLRKLGESQEVIEALVEQVGELEQRVAQLSQ